jgi:hypothetical protein
MSELLCAGELGSTGLDPELDVPVFVVPELVVPELVVPELVAPELVVPKLVVPELVVPEFVVPALGAELDVANASADALVALDATGGVSTAPPPPPPPQAVKATRANAAAAVKENAVEAREVFRRSMVSLGVSLPPSELKSFGC